METYYVMDSRAAIDVDDALILETLGEFDSDESAGKKAKKSWGNQGACLAIAVDQTLVVVAEDI